MAQQSNLERIGIDEREHEFIKSPYTYNEETPYSASHPDAQSDGDVRGKGTDTPLTVLDIPTEKLRHDDPQPYGETVNTDAGGGLYDVAGTKGVQGAFQGDAGRNYLLTSHLNVYNKNSEYGKDSVDTSNNVPGQYWIQ